MGINSAADKWKWLAINIMDHTLPRVNVVLDEFNPVIPMLRRLLAWLTILCMLGIVVIIICMFNQSDNYRRQSFHFNYLRIQYGSTIDVMTRTYVNLIKHHSERVRRLGVGSDTERTNVLLIGVNESVEAYIRYERGFASDETLQSLLPSLGRPLAFNTIEDALNAVDVYCRSGEKVPKTLFILLLISSQDPSWGPHEHKKFQVPKSLRDHCYAIVGTGETDVFAHKLSRSSKGVDGEPLMKSLPCGQKDSRVCF